MTGTSMLGDNSFGIYGQSDTTTRVTVGPGRLTFDNSRILMRAGIAEGDVGNELILGGDVTASGTSTIQRVSTGDYPEGSSTVWLSSAAGPSVTRTFDVDGAASHFRIAADITDGEADEAGILKTGDGTLTLQGTNVYTGGTTVAEGVLTIQATNALPDWNEPGGFSVADGAVLAIRGNVSEEDFHTMRTLTDNFEAAGASGIDTRAGSRTFESTITGEVPLAKVGSGTLRLTGDNEHTGLTIAAEGTLMLDSPGTAVPGDLLISGGSVRFYRDNQIDNEANVIMTAGHLNSDDGSSSGRRNPHVETLAGLTAIGGTFQTGTLGSQWTISGPGSFTGGEGETAVMIGSATQLSFGGLTLTDMTSQTVTGANSFTIYGQSGDDMTRVSVGSGGLTLDNSRILMRKGLTEDHKGGAIVLGGDVTATGTSTIELTFEGVGGPYIHGPAVVQLSGTGSPDPVTRTFNVDGEQSHLWMDVDVTNGEAATAGIRKTGHGTLTLAGTNTYTGSTAAEQGTLLVNGSLASDVALHQGATLAGSGTIAAHVAGGGGGAGLVSPGNSAGILTVDSIDPSGGMRFAFEFGQTGSPDYSDAGNSINDVLRLTGNPPAFGFLTSANVVDVYFNVDDLDIGDVFRGGVYVDVATEAAHRDEFFEMVKYATYNYQVAGGNGYMDLTQYHGLFDVSLSIVADPADFGGLIHGAVMQFTVIPEPGSFALLTFGLLGLLALGRRRRVRF